MSNVALPLRVFLVDDEPLALKRLSRLLQATGRVEIVGSATDPKDAVAHLSKAQVDVVFLDIEMPGMNGFEMLTCLPHQQVVIFTTAFDQYALRAFEVNSIDYLLKPVDPRHLERALNKVARLRGTTYQPDWHKVIEELATALHSQQTRFPNRIASPLGERTKFIELAQVTYFVSADRLTYAVTSTNRHVVAQSIAELERILDPKIFVRIHRSILVNSAYVKEVDQWFAGRALVRLEDGKGTELAVARDRVRRLKDHLGF